MRAEPTGLFVRWSLTSACRSEISADNADVADSLLRLRKTSPGSRNWLPERWGLVHHGRKRRKPFAHPPLPEREAGMKPGGPVSRKRLYLHAGVKDQRTNNPAVAGSSPVRRAINYYDKET